MGYHFVYRIWKPNGHAAVIKKVPACKFFSKMIIVPGLL